VATIHFFDSAISEEQQLRNVIQRIGLGHNALCSLLKSDASPYAKSIQADWMLVLRLVNP
jgi:hypothetical protein